MSGDTLPHMLEAIRERLFRAIPAAWPELAAALEAALPDPPPPLVILPLAACMAARGELERALPAASAWAALNLSLRILDDLEDRDRPEGWWAKLGLGRAHHLAASLRELSLHLLLEGPADEPTKFEVVKDLSQTLLRAFHGQDRDLAGRAATLEEAWQILEDKSGTLFSFACRAAARLGGGAPADVEALSRFGFHLGVGLQLVDDWESTLAESGARDLRIGKLSFPIHAALKLGSEAEREQTRALIAPPPPWDIERLGALLEATGARSFTLWVAHEERQKALAELETLAPEGALWLRRFCEVPFPPLEGAPEPSPSPSPGPPFAPR